MTNSIKIQQRELSRAANATASLVKRSATTLPVLTNVLVEASGNVVSFVGTDLESHIRAECQATIEGTGLRFTIPAARLSEIVALFDPTDEVTIRPEGGNVVVETESATYKLASLPADDFPLWTEESATCAVQLPGDDLLRLIDSVLYALPAKDHRRVLMGALCQIGTDERLQMTATDGKKLARASVQAESLDTDNKSGVAVISGKLLADIRKQIAGSAPVRFEIGERQAAFVVSGIEYRTNVFDGKFPDCDAVIPKEFAHTVRLSRDAFKLAAKRAGVVSQDQNRSVILKFAGNACDFSAMAADVGTYHGSVPVEMDGEPVEIGYNWQLMCDTLDSFESDKIVLRIKSPQSPSVLTCEGDGDHLCVLMPIKLAELKPKE